MNSRMRKRKKEITLWSGVGMLGFLVFLALLAPVICKYDPLEMDLYNILTAPGSGHLFGTDALGRDIFSRILYAARTDLCLMVLAEIIPFSVGLVLGMAAGYFGGKVDKVIGLACDVFIAFPFYLLVIVIAFATGAGVRGIFITYALVGWLVYCKVSRGQTSSLRQREWVAAAEITGYSGGRILLREIMPNVLPQAVVLLANDMVGLLGIIVTLGYLGIGVTAPSPDWGTMISEGQTMISSAWWLTVIPGLFVVYTGISLSLIGDGLADRWR